MSERLTHVGLCIREVDRSVAFYRDGLGFQEVGRMRASGERCERLLDVPDPDLELVFMERDGFRLEVIGLLSGQAEGDGKPRRIDALGFTHLSFRVDDPDQLAAQLVDAGGRVLPEREVTFDGGNRGLMVLDPDGTLIELIERIKS